MVEIVKAINGNLTIKKDNIYLLSNYNPKKDIARFVDKTELKRNEFYIIFGIALGYLPEEIEKRGVLSSEIFVFLPAEEEKKFLNPKYSLINNINISTLFEKKLSEGKKPKIIALESYKKAFSQEFNTFENLVTSNIKIAVENLKVTSFFSKVWFFNSLRNIVLLLEKGWKYLEIKNKINTPILICSAGPSLNLKIKEIKENRKNFILISVLSASETLLSNDIKPDGIIITDGGVVNSHYFRNIPFDVPIFADIYASSSFLSKLSNPVIFLNLKEEMTNPSFQLKEASVSITAIKLAKIITNSKVIVSGFDMAYSIKYGSHSFPNVFTLPYLEKFNKLSPLENYTLSFIKRDDIIAPENTITNKQFLLMRELVKQEISDCYFLENEIGLKVGNSQKVFEKENRREDLIIKDISRDVSKELITKFLDFISSNIEEIAEGLLLKEKLKNIEYERIKKNIFEKTSYFMNKIKTQLQY